MDAHRKPEGRYSPCCLVRQEIETLAQYKGAWHLDHYMDRDRLKPWRPSGSGFPTFEAALAEALRDARPCVIVVANEGLAGRDIVIGYVHYAQGEEAERLVTADERRAAYYAGRNAADGIGENKNPYANAVLAEEWRTGWRHVKAEDRLNADTGWD